MLPPQLKYALENELTAHFGGKTHIRRAVPLTGGSINQAARLETRLGSLFVKWNDGKRHPRMFEREAAGLQLLQSAGAFKIPDVVMHGQTAGLAFLVLEYLSAGTPDGSFWPTFGKRLAKLHQNTSDRFGLGHDNYMGSLPQCNKWGDSFVDFFVNQRLKPQVNLALQTGKMPAGAAKRFDSLYAKLGQLIPNEPPALVHGDLWAGNVMAGEKGQPALIDPAAHYGHREADLAMTRLFGGFDQNTLLRAYNEVRPLQAGFEERCDLYSLYPLLVHVNLFGGGYLQSVLSILNRFA